MALTTFGGFDDVFGPLFGSTAGFPFSSAMATAGHDQPSMRGMALDVIEKKGAPSLHCPFVPPRCAHRTACVSGHGISVRQRVYACISSLARGPPTCQLPTVLQAGRGRNMRACCLIIYVDMSICTLLYFYVAELQRQT